MRYVSVAVVAALGWCLSAAGLGMADAPHENAKEHKAAEAGGHGPKEYELRYHHDKKKPLVIDPDNQAHREEVLNAIANGEAEELVERKTVNLMELKWELGLWTVVVFVLLFIILKKLAWGPMLEGLHRREESIFGALNEAEKARAEAKSLREQLQKELDNAGEKVRQVLEEGRRSAERLQEEMMTKTKAEIGAERDRLHREIGMARDQALKDVWQQTAQLATLVSAKTIKRDLGLDDHRRLVDEAVAELSQTVDARREAWGTSA